MGLATHRAPTKGFYNVIVTSFPLSQVDLAQPQYHNRTPAMAAGLADHGWTMRELLSYPVYPPVAAPARDKIRTYKDVLKRLKGGLAAEALS